jgi:uncharacterized protein
MANDKRRIIVTGANGFIGSRIVARLVRDGDTVVAFVRDIERSRPRLPQGVELVKWSHADASGPWRSMIDGADGIVNLAGTSIGQRWTASHKKSVHDSRILGTRHLVEAIAAAERAPRVLVNASAVGYYGFCPSGTVSEDSPPGDDFLARVCTEWEREAMGAAGHGVRVVLVRNGVVLHRDEGALPRMILPFKLFVGGPIGSGNQPLPWVHIDDVVEIFRWALRDERVNGPLNATAPDVVTNREFSSALGRALHRPAIVPTPAFAIQMVLGEGAVLVTGGQRAVPHRTESLGYRFRHPKLAPALESVLAG